MRDDFRADVAAGAGAVVGDDLLLPRLAELAAEQPVTTVGPQPPVLATTMRMGLTG